jgi:hypothetical protein
MNGFARFLGKFIEARNIFTILKRSLKDGYVYRKRYATWPQATLYASWK